MSSGAEIRAAALAAHQQGHLPTMKRLAIPLTIGALAALGAVAAVSAADPDATPAPVATEAPVATAPVATEAPAATPAPVANPPLVRGPDTGTLSGILGISQSELAQLRAQGQTLAQVAESRGIDPQRLIEALVAQWGARIDARAAAGALTADQAAALKANLQVEAKAMVNQATPGGMRGGAVGAGPGAMGGRGPGNGTGGGMGRWSTDDGGQPRGMGRWGNGSGAGNGTCPMTTAPGTAS